MLVGILVSGVYEHKSTVTLHRNEAATIGRHTLTFTRTAWVTDDGDVKRTQELDPAKLADRRAKQAMEVEVTSAGRKTWKAYPKMYVNERTNQMMANPDVNSSPLMDLYLSPQSYDPGSPAKTEGTVASLKKGESKTLHGVSFKFLEFEADRSRSARAVRGDGDHALPRHHEDAVVEEIAQLIMFLGGAEGPPPRRSETPIPGTKGRFKIHRVSASEGMAEFEVLGSIPQATSSRRPPRASRWTSYQTAHLARLGRLLPDHGGRFRRDDPPRPRRQKGGPRGGGGPGPGVRRSFPRGRHR
ncbi:MAG: hypothetical protein IPP07_30305 [Holophagales bacterium]|nr:hypothetical protein [Holophagales bacterium]